MQKVLVRLFGGLAALFRFDLAVEEGRRNWARLDSSDFSK